MKFKIITHDHKTHVYHSNMITNVLDLIIALEDFDYIILSGTKYLKDSIVNIQEID